MQPAARTPIGFYIGLFLAAAALLGLQILQTRILSVTSWYFLAFFAISMSMFGMTAGSLAVYFAPKWVAARPLAQRLAELSVYFALAIVVSWLFLINSMIVTDYAAPLPTALVWVKLVIVLAFPYVIGGALVAIALTRSPYPIGRVYAVDLAGAAAGCIVVLAVMSVMDGVSAVLAVAAMTALAGVFFRTGLEPGAHRALPGAARSAGIIAFAIAAAAIANATLYPHGARLYMVKNDIMMSNDFETAEWNSFSRIDVFQPRSGPPFLWGPSSAMPTEEYADSVARGMRIDGEAGTVMYRFSGDREEVAFLAYDITNLAYAIRNRGDAAVIGVGGGRDVLSAYYFGFEDIVGIDINEIFIRNLTERYPDFNSLAALPGVTLVVDEARSWFARTDRTFDLVQMSLIDTWAATGVGAFSLTENGLYTIEGWQRFIGTLKPDGVFTVSRWLAPDNPGETGRIVSLAKATLFSLGVEDANAHVYLAATGRLSTIIVSRAPLSEADLATLNAESERLNYTVLMAPDTPATDPVIAKIQGAASTAELESLADDSILNFSPPSDDNPFFFNQLKLSALPDLFRGGHTMRGVISGNVIATVILFIIIAVSVMAVLVTVVLPTLPAVRRVKGPLAAFGTGYFLLIGLGFMFVEIALMQRLSIFLGHPVYGLAIALAGIILATGLGSALSERIPLDTGPKLAAWALLTAGFLASAPFWLPPLVATFDGSGILVRSLVSLVAILPAGLLLGFGFPTGMRLVSAVDDGPTPWFWAVNGAAGVLASGMAVAVGTFVSINASFTIAAVCYALILPMAFGLAHLGRGARPATAEAPAAPAE